MLAQMIPQRQKFKYSKSQKIIYWGCEFDSLLELKYAISIQDEYEFLRNRITIYYHHGSNKPTDYIREGVRHYTPDFLIRHKQTGEAFLIEVKPREAEHDPKLVIRKAVTENFIRWKDYDWKYKLVFSDEISLTDQQVKIYEECAKLKSKAGYQGWFSSYNKRIDRSSPSFLSTAPGNGNAQFVMLGYRNRNPGFG